MRGMILRRSGRPLFYDRQTQTPALIYAQTGPDRMAQCRMQSLPDGRLWVFYEELDGSGRIANPARRIRNLRPPPSFTISPNGVESHGRIRLPRK